MFYQLDLVFPIEQEYPFSYLYQSPEDKNYVGFRAIAPLKNNFYSAIVVAQKKIADDTINSNLKFVTELIDESRFLLDNQIDLAFFISEYYCDNIGNVFSAIIPSSFLPEIKHFYTLKNEYTHITSWKKIVNKSKIIYEILKFAKENILFTKSILTKKIGRKIQRQLQYLVANGVLEETFQFNKAKAKIKIIKYVEPLKIKSVDKNKIRKNAVLQNEIIDFLINLKHPMPVNDLVNQLGFSRVAFNSLAKRKLINTYDIEFDRMQTQTDFSSMNSDYSLTVKQKEISELIKKQIDAFKVHLIYGITGSGKTLIYIDLMKEIIRKEKSVLYLIPEISLTSQTVSRLQNAFGNQITYIHSKMTENEKFDAWHYIKTGKYKIIVGPRSALFSPLINCGLIIVDEEHEWTYKQSEKNPRYHARDTAIFLAHRLNIPIVLGSATPSVESMYHSQNNKYNYYQLLERPNDIKSPTIEISDLLLEKSKSFENIPISQKLELEIEKRLIKKEQIILFLNRRGYASILQCSSCGFVDTCPNCSVTLVYHKTKELLICHYCNYSEIKQKTCKKCSEESLLQNSFGTQKCEEQIRALYPNAKIARMDSDNTKKKNSHQEILERFAEKKIDILIGTQMISKGLDFPNVTLVAVICADQAFAIPDFRSHERAFQLLSQVAGRSGRGEKTGKVIVQAYQTNSPILDFIKRNHYLDFYNREITNRKEYNYPPFNRLISIEIKGEDPQTLIKTSHELANLLKQIPAVQILGPTVALIEKVNHKYCWKVLIKSKLLQFDKKIKKHLLKLIEYQKRHQTGISFQIDVDPISIV